MPNGVVTVDAGLARVAAAWRPGSRVTVLTGAGVSATSGVPTFRGEDGLWRRYRPEELATPEGFARDPQLVWEWYDWRRQTIAGCRPNPAHEVLARWSSRFPRFRLVTQNVDGLHERAGTREVVRLHGSLWDLRCAAGCPGAPPRWRDDTVPLVPLPPRCPSCGGLARPDVVWFGEPLDSAVLTAALAALSCDLLLVVGTSSVVYPAAGFLAEARRRGALGVEINPAATAASALADIVLPAPAEQALVELDARLAG